MKQKDQMKLLAAGFTIIRSEVLQKDIRVVYSYSKRIKAKTLLRPNWHIYEDKFKNAAALHRRMVELLKDPKIVED